MCTCGSASHDPSEHTEPIYYRPLPRPQASAPSRTRCVPRSSSASTCPSRRTSSAAMRTAARAAAAAAAAGAAGARRIRRHRSRDQAHASGRRPRRPSGVAHWSLGVDCVFRVFLWKSLCWHVQCVGCSHAPAEVDTPFERVTIGLQSVWYSLAGEHGMGLTYPPQNHDLREYEG